MSDRAEIKCACGCVVGNIRDGERYVCGDCLLKERDGLLAACERNVAAFDEIDRETPFTESEPSWWLGWSEQARIARAAILKAKGGTSHD